MSNSFIMSRRQAMVIAAASGTSAFALQQRPANSGQKLLSKSGSGRATAYVEANRIVTNGNKKHVTWQDSTSQGFRVRIKTLDTKSETWSPTYTLGKCHDNHGGPAMTMDSRGHLHIVYFPHHHPFRYRKAKRPNDASKWEDEIQFGEKLTYPTLICAADDTLHLTARRSHSDRPWVVEHWVKEVNKDWMFRGEILRSRVAGYSHFQESITWGPDHRSLHLSCRIYENGGKVETVGYMRSDDYGQSWRRLDGSNVKLPASPDSLDVLAVGGRVPGKMSHKCGCMVVDPQGKPHVLYSAAGDAGAQMIWSTPQKDGWRRTNLAQFLPKQWSNWKMSPPSMMVFDERGIMYVAASVARADQREVLLMSSEDGNLFEVEHVSAGSEAAGSEVEQKMWPSLERPTGHNRVTTRPGLIYTAGVRGKGNDDLLSNEVHWSS